MSPYSSIFFFDAVPDFFEEELRFGSDAGLGGSGIGLMESVLKAAQMCDVGGFDCDRLVERRWW